MFFFFERKKSDIFLLLLFFPRCTVYLFLFLSLFCSFFIFYYYYDYKFMCLWLRSSFGLSSHRTTCEKPTEKPLSRTDSSIKFDFVCYSCVQILFLIFFFVNLFSEFRNFYIYFLLRVLVQWLMVGSFFPSAKIRHLS